MYVSSGRRSPKQLKGYQIYENERKIYKRNYLKRNGYVALPKNQIYMKLDKKRN